MQTNEIETLEDFGKAFDEMQAAEQAEKDRAENSSASAGIPESSVTELTAASEHAPTEEAKEKPVEERVDAPSKELLDTYRGRLRESDRARNALAQETEALRKELEAAKTAKPRQRVEIDENLSEDIKEFESRYPNLVSVIKEESQDGDEARMILAEFGTGQAMMFARTVLAEKSISEKEKRLRESFEKKATEDHWESIFEEVPEVAAMNSEQAASFSEDLRNWILDQPRAQREQFEAIFNGDVKPKVKQVVNLYKSYFEATVKKSRSEEISDKAKDAEAIPSRSRGSGLPPRPTKRDLTNAADFEAAFNELAEKENRYK